MDIISIIIQIGAIAVLIVLTVWVFVPYFIDIGPRVESTKPLHERRDRLSITLIDGVMNFFKVPSEGEVFETVLKNTPNYVSLPRSANQKGGAEFSYSFWWNEYGIDPNAVKDKIILHRGQIRKAHVTELKKHQVPLLDNIVYAHNGFKSVMDRRTNENSLDLELDPEDQGKYGYYTIQSGNDLGKVAPLVNSPMVCLTDSGILGDSKLYFRVYMNTMKRPAHSFLVKNDVVEELRKKMLIDKWYLVTMTFTDYVGEDGMPSGIIFKVYFNDVEVFTDKLEDDALRISDDPLYVMPNHKVSQMTGSETEKRWSDSVEMQGGAGGIADVVYHNYALSQGEINSLYKKGMNPNEYSTAFNKNRNSRSKYYILAEDGRLIG
jgi:hypothetical protein